MAIGFTMTIMCDKCDDSYMLFSTEVLTNDDIMGFIHKFQDQGWFISGTQTECLKCFGLDGWEPGVRRGSPAKRPQLVR